MSYRRQHVYAYTARPLGQAEDRRTTRAAIAMGVTGLLGLAAIGYVFHRAAQTRAYTRSARRWG